MEHYILFAKQTAQHSLGLRMAADRHCYGHMLKFCTDQILQPKEDDDGDPPCRRP